MLVIMEEAAGRNSRILDSSSGVDTNELRDLGKSIFDMMFPDVNQMQIICLQTSHFLCLTLLDLRAFFIALNPVILVALL